MNACFTPSYFTPSRAHGMAETRDGFPLSAPWPSLRRGDAAWCGLRGGIAAAAAAARRVLH